MSLVHGPVQHAVMLGDGSKTMFGDLRGGKGLSVLLTCSFGLFCLVLIHSFLISVSPSNSSASSVFSVLVVEETHQYL